MKDETAIRSARAEMDAAKAQSENTLGTDQRLPRRYKLYDRIKDHVSLKTVDTVIVVTAVLIIGFLIYGILTANPPQ